MSGWQAGFKLTGMGGRYGILMAGSGLIRISGRLLRNAIGNGLFLMYLVKIFPLTGTFPKTVGYSSNLTGGPLIAGQTRFLNRKKNISHHAGKQGKAQSGNQEGNRNPEVYFAHTSHRLS
ncbi:hypothetical protein A6M21_12470 [Desulfotomaculum copahuensis]|uniref:Uncharacterized protein n=1 Tax=Desulfotomaculum copahuensis TaxID=1838280 RepID=A0A1B7LD19_9FIRM|nr:hypothetical protein A6M21_12470 [Desulfotomaculum copahuensis]